jgi:GntR family transcriptional regulator / MocR family aminotransferase
MARPRRMKIATLPIRIEGGGALQEQIYSSIRRCILEGLIGAEQRLPSTRALASELGVSRTTVLLAVESLYAEGYLVSRRGAGMFVAREMPDSRPRPDPPAPLAVVERHPLLSARGRALAESRGPDRRRTGPPRPFRLGTPALDLFPVQTWSRIARHCVSTATVSRLDYSPLAGLAALREAISEQVRARGTRCDPEQVIVTAGAQRALDLVFHLLIDHGQPVGMEEPGYPGAHNALLAAGARPVPVPVDEDGMRVEELAAHPEVHMAYITPSHQFPLGVPMSLERRQRLLDWARSSRAWVVEDDYDCDFRYHAQPLPCLHALDPDGRVIYVGTFSKTLFPGLRLGFLIVPHDLAGGFVQARLGSDVHPPALEQAILAEFMARGHYQRHLRRMQAAYAERLDALRRAIDESGAPLRLRPVHSGLHAVADLDGLDAEDVFERAAARAIEVMPLSHYYAGPGRAPNALVLGFAAVSPEVIRSDFPQLASAMAGARRLLG